MDDSNNKILEKGELPEDLKNARRIRIRAGRFSIINEELYRQSYGGPYLKCLTPEEGINVLSQIHEATCENHYGGRSLG